MRLEEVNRVLLTEKANQESLEHALEFVLKLPNSVLLQESESVLHQFEDNCYILLADEFLFEIHYQIVGCLTKLSLAGCPFSIDIQKTLPPLVYRKLRSASLDDDEEGVYVCLTCLASFCSYYNMLTSLCNTETNDTLSLLSGKYLQKYPIMQQITCIAMYFATDERWIDFSRTYKLLHDIVSYTRQIYSNSHTYISRPPLYNLYPLLSIFHNISSTEKGMELLSILRCIRTMKDLSRYFEDDSNISDECCRILLRYAMSKEYYQKMYDEGGIDLLITIGTKCLRNEETVRMVCQVLRVIASAHDDGISIMLKEWKIVSFIDIIFKLFATSSSAILLHCYFTLYYIIKYCGSQSSSSLSQLFQELLDIHIISVIQSTLEQHREPRLLRIAYILLYELSSFQQTHDLPELSTTIFNSFMNEKILPLTLSVIQWIPIDSETLISALNFLNIVGRKEKAREQLVQTDCIPILVRFLSMSNVPADVQVLSVALLSRLAKLESSREIMISHGCVQLLITLIVNNVREPAMIFCGLSCLNFLAYHNYTVCKQLHSHNAFSLIIKLCVLYEKKDMGIVIQCLGLVNSILAVSVSRKTAVEIMNDLKEGCIFHSLDPLINSLLDNDIVQLLNSIMVFYKKKVPIVHQCVSSMNLLSLTLEGKRHLLNMNNMIENLTGVLDLHYNSKEICVPLTAILERLGCINV